MDLNAWVIQNNSSDLQTVRTFFRDQKIVYCSGSFDLTHPGHVLFFEDCKKHGDILVVGVGCDANIRSAKGNDRPVMNETLRLKMISSLRAVDVCFLDAYAPKENEHPLDFLNIVFRYLHPDIYAVNSDASYMRFRTDLAWNFEIKFLVLERACPPEFENISTSSLIQKIQTNPH